MGNDNQPWLEEYVNTVKKYLRQEQPNLSEEEIELEFRKLDLIAQATYSAWLEAKALMRKKEKNKDCSSDNI